MRYAWIIASMYYVIIVDFVGSFECSQRNKLKLNLLS